MKYLFSLSWGLLLTLSVAQAQLFGTHPDSSRTWKIRFWLDGSAKPMSFIQRDAYQGEVYDFQTDTWSWQESDSTQDNVTDFKKVNHVSLNVLLNVYRGLYAGFGYHLVTIRGFNFFPNGGGYYTTNDALVALTGNLAYEWAIPQFERLRVQPSVAFGRYQGSLYYEGLGDEWFGEARLGLAFRPLKRHSIRAWVAYGGYSYREDVPSYVFIDQARAVRTDLRYLSAGIGLSFRLHIQEEPLEDEKPRRKKRKKKE